MKKALYTAYWLSIVGGIVLCATSYGQSPVNSGLPALSPIEKVTLESWFRRDDSDAGASNVGSICVLHGLPAHTVKQLIGPPMTHLSSTNRLVYGYAPSRVLELVLDDRGLVKEAKLTGNTIAIRDSSHVTK